MTGAHDRGTGSVSHENVTLNPSLCHACGSEHVPLLGSCGTVPCKRLVPRFHYNRKRVTKVQHFRGLLHFCCVRRGILTLYRIRSPRRGFDCCTKKLEVWIMPKKTNDKNDQNDKNKKNNKNNNSQNTQRRIELFL